MWQALLAGGTAVGVISVLEKQITRIARSQKETINMLKLTPVNRWLFKKGWPTQKSSAVALTLKPQESIRSLRLAMEHQARLEQQALYRHRR